MDYSNLDPNVIAVILGVLAAVAIVGITYLRATNNKKWLAIAEMIAPVLPALVARAETVLAPYGPQLKPVHELIEAGQTLIDDDDDWLVLALPRAWVEAARKGAEIGEDLTDGVVEPPPQEHIPASKPTDATHV